MSLTQREREITGAELRRHAEVSGWQPDELASWLGLDEPTVSEVLAMRDTDPVLAWYVRDALDALVRSQGADAGGWSILTDGARVRAGRWFRLRELPSKPSA